MAQELKLRIVSGLVMAVAVLLATWLGGLAFNALSAAIGGLVFYEWMAMGRARSGVSASGFPEIGSMITVVGWLSFAIAAVFVLFDQFYYGGCVLALAAIGLLFFSVPVRSKRWVAGGLAYAGAVMVSLAAIREGDSAGFFAMLFVFAVVWTTDIMAYFTGRFFKGPKLAPSISPGKTWSGAVGGVFFAVLAAVAVCFNFGGRLTLLVAMLALVMSAVSQVGDLFESSLKRKCGVKDSSKLIPGHGGVMDRIDGLVAAAFLLFIVAMVAQLLSPAGLSTVGDMLSHWSGVSALNASNGA